MRPPVAAVAVEQPSMSADGAKLAMKCAEAPEALNRHHGETLFQKGKEVFSGHMVRARRRDQLELIASYALPDQPSAQVLERKLTLGSWCAYVCSALRVVRPSVVSVVIGRASGTLRVLIKTSNQVRAG